MARGFSDDVKASEADEDVVAEAAYQAWLSAQAPGVTHPWETLSDEEKEGWRSVVKAVKGK